MNIDLNDPLVIAGAIVAVVLIVAAIAIAVHQSRKRSADLRSRFGSEYDLALREHGARKQGRGQAAGSREARAATQIRELSRPNRIATWRSGRRCNRDSSTIRAEQ